MKRGTIRHPKLLRLARRLGCEPYCALGLLEALLDWTFDYARAGDVGRFRDHDLAEAVGWTKDAGELVNALVETRWLDRCPVHRLVIHDLADHASETWKQLMRRQHREFARTSPGPVPDESRTDPGLVRAMTVPPAPAPAPAPDLLSLATLACASTTEFDEFWKAYPRHVDKQKARKAWAKLRPPPLKAILDALTWQRELPDWRKDHGDFVPYPATYLNGRRWEDERPPDPLTTLVARLEAKGLV
jgi:hypothetical protein